VVGRTTLDGAIVSLARAFGPGLMTLLAWGVLSFGAVYPWAYWPLFAGAAVFGVWGVAATHGWRDPRVRALTYALGAVVAAMSVQIVALPAWLIARLSPGVDRFFRQFEIGYHPASLHTLSLDPAATAVNLAEVAALGALLLGAARAMRNVKIEWLTSQIMGLAIGVATIGIVQKALGKANQPLVYGFWHSIEPGSPFGPFINRNHFAGWMAMALPLVVAYAWALLRQSERPAQSGPRGWIRWATSVDGNRTALVASAALIMGVATVLTQSRSGMAAVTVALLTVAWFIGRRSGGRWRAAAIAYVVVVLLGAVSWAGADLVAARFQRAPAEIGGRLAAWRDTVGIVRDFRVFGVGVGGYARAMLVYQSGSRERMFAEAHNDYLQMLAEGGALVCVPAIGVAAVFIAGVRRRLTSTDDDEMTFWLRRGAVAGLLAAAAQSCVEFSLQMPGNAALFVVLAAMALHRPRSGTHAYRV
jgi:O-antigen ligase